MKAKIETVFEVLGEGGGLKISRLTQNKEVRYLFNHQEFDPTDEGLGFDINDSFTTFDEPYELINKYPWHLLHIETLHNDFTSYLSVKLVEKLNYRKEVYLYIHDKIKRLELLLKIILFENNCLWTYGNIDNKAKTKWQKSAISLENYQLFISRKSERFSLTLVDLLYVSNFKGGNSTINDSEQEVNIKLLSYSEILNKIDKEFSGFSLNTLNNKDLDSLISIVNSICKLTDKTSETNIDGFSISYLSALLHSYFPLLIPILDRRVLIGLKLVSQEDVNSQGQIKDLENYYADLIIRMYDISKYTQQTIREIDKSYFILDLKNMKN